MATRAARCRIHPEADAEASCSRCGDFLCAPCAGASESPLCPRCATRSTLEWEERGDATLGAAFLHTFLESVGAPGRLGQRVGGTGHSLAALSYAALAALVGLFPLSLITAALLLAASDPRRLGLRSTSLLTIAVLSLLSPLLASALYAFGLSLWSFLVWLWLRMLHAAVRYDHLLRLSAYGMSLLAVPLFGPLLLPWAVMMMLWALYRALSGRLGGLRAGLALAGSASPVVLGFWLWLMGSEG